MRLNITAVGDIAPGDSIIHGIGICNLTKKYGCDYPFQNLKNRFNNTDLLIGNLEGALSERSRNEDLRLCGLPEMASSLKKAEFDVVSIANNHAFDHGPEIFRETVLLCQNAGLKVCGLRGSSGYYSQPVIIKKNNLTIGILAYNWIGLEHADNISEYIAVVRDGVVNYSWNRDKKADQIARTLIKDKNKDVISDIRKLKNEVDLLILIPHWGIEWSNYPPYGVVLEARSFIDAGVNIIAGSHPHVMQGIEKYKGGLIAYSLGNFLFDSISDKPKYGLILECKAGADSIEDYKIDFIKRGNYFQPELVSKKENKFNLEIINKSSEAITSSDAECLLDDDLIYQVYESQYNENKRKKVLYLFKALFKNPRIIQSLFLKVLNLIYLILLRIKGKKIRW